MNYETVSNAYRGEEPAFTDQLEATCSDMHVLSGRVEPCVCREQTRPEIEIVIPGERASAEISYRTADGGRQRQSMGDRQISIIPPEQPHQLSWQRGAELMVIRLNPEFMNGIAHECGMRGIQLIGQYATLDPVIWHLGRGLRGELRRHLQLNTAYLSAIATVLARHLLSTYAFTIQHSSRSGGLPRYKLRRAIEYVNDNIMGGISFRDIAAHLKMSAYHFARMFKQSTGESPHQYIMRCRIERAKMLLAEDNVPISDIALDVGYKSQSHFTTCFGRLTGVTPAAFRASN